MMSQSVLKLKNLMKYFLILDWNNQQIGRKTKIFKN